MSLTQVLRESEMDRFLTGNPQITYFKSVYRRHTPFYKGVHTYQEHLSVGGRTIKEELSYGSYDLITNIFLENKIEQSVGGTIFANLGNNIINEIKFNVGGQALFQTYGLYMEARAELDHPYVPSIDSTNSVPPIMVGTTLSKCNTGSQYNVQTIAGGVTGLASVTTTDTFYTYPNFYFCRDYGNAFPICALNNTEVELEIKYRENLEIFGGTASEFTSTVNVEYVKLSDDERMRFINNTESYIFYDIEHLSYQNPLDYNNGGKNHPIRQFFFVGENTASAAATSHSTPVSLSGLSPSLNGIDLKINSESLYENEATNLSIFTKQNINKMYPGYGRELGTGSQKGYTDSIGVHAFCLDTTNTPSGHLSANIPFIVYFKNATGNIQTYLEVIKYYRIMGGQLHTIYI